MRRAPDRAPTPIARRSESVIRDERTYQFLTPVFGGGVRVEEHIKHADPITPVRVPSIRGQLRFWWRACNPQRCGTVDELRKKEAEVFGSTSRPSPLSIVIVRPPEPARDFAVLEGKFGAVKGRDEIAYAAFPLRDTGQQEPRQHGQLHEHRGDWIVAFSYPEKIQSDVQAALWAWAHFGGLGGRTRRGFGAIAEIARLTKPAGGSVPPLASIEEGWRRHVTGADVGWPHLPAWDHRRLVIQPRGEGQGGIEAQRFLLGALRSLRQIGYGRKPAADDEPGNHPGRSYWPEADAIRKLLKTSKPSHGTPVTKPDAFPRAAFGTPIIFHFMGKGDPEQTTLVPKDKNRLASRLLLRPHRGEGGGIEALALVLEHPAPAGFELNRAGSKTPLKVRTTLSPDEAKHMGMNGRPSPLVKDGQVFEDPIERFLKEIS